jgi:hypothetical protein
VVTLHHILYTNTVGNDCLPALFICSLRDGITPDHATLSAWVQQTPEAQHHISPSVIIKTLCLLLPTLAGNSPDHAYTLSLGAARRLDSGGLLKTRLDHSGAVSLLYQQAVPGMGQLALSCQLDPLSLTKVAPSVGFSLNVA